MINKIAQPNILYINEAMRKVYNKFKALILKIFSLLKRHEHKRNIKDEFYKAYIDFSRKLKAEGHDRECYFYMSICEMYHELMSRPEELIAHESFFIDFFNAFEDLLFAKLVKSDEYEIKSKQFLIYWGNMHDYYYGHVAIPSDFYDKDVVKKITGKLAGDFNG